MWDDVRGTAGMATLGELQHTKPPDRIRLYSNKARSPFCSGI
jgi:hypothetical protein